MAKRSRKNESQAVDIADLQARMEAASQGEPSQNIADSIDETYCTVQSFEAMNEVPVEPTEMVALQFTKDDVEEAREALKVLAEKKSSETQPIDLGRYPMTKESALRYNRDGELRRRFRRENVAARAKHLGGQVDISEFYGKDETIPAGATCVGAPVSETERLECNEAIRPHWYGGLRKDGSAVRQPNGNLVEFGPSLVVFDKKAGRYIVESYGTRCQALMSEAAKNADEKLNWMSNRRAISTAEWKNKSDKEIVSRDAKRERNENVKRVYLPALTRIKNRETTEAKREVRTAQPESK